MSNKGPFTHNEAYCVMQYESDDGKTTELLWNSRDGVTPFCVTAKDNETTLQHVRWGEDKREPFYQPEPGMRCFVDLTKERAQQLAKESVEAWFSDEEKRAFCEKGGVTREQLLVVKTNEMDFACKNKQPDIIEATPEWVATLVRPRVQRRVKWEQA